MTEQTSLNETQQDPETGEPTGKDWTSKTAIKVGLILGAVLGLLFATGYAGGAAWACSGIRDCPTHPAPYLIAGGVVWAFTIIIVTGISLVLHKLYRLFKVV